MDKYLILGGGGFIGKALVHNLSGKYSLRIYDRFEIPEFSEMENVEVVTGNFQTQEFDSLLEGVTGVIHLISTTVPSEDTSNIPAEIEQNVIPTVRLLESMVRMGVKRILYASSAGTVYGETDGRPSSVSDALNPQCSYGVQKKVNESYLQFYGLRHGIDYRIMRMTNPYGWGQDPNKMQGLIPIFINKLLNGEPISVFGDGENVRDYIFVRDVVAGIASVAAYHGEQRIFNLGSGETYTINEIIRMLEEESGLKFVNINHLPDRLCDVHKNLVDTKSSQDELNWYPVTNLKQGIQMTLQVLKAQMKQ